MPELTELINRKDEVKSINKLIQEIDNHAVVFLRGAGGLGKTRLLQEIHKMYKEQDEFLVTEIIDFDDRSLHTLEGLEIQIAQELGVEADVAEEIRELRELRSKGATQRILDGQQREITYTLKNQCNELSKNRRILLFFDTVEKIEESTLRRLLLLLFHFDNGVFLFAGRPFPPHPRPQIDIAQLMKNQFGEKAHVIDIDPLKEDERREYLQAKLGVDSLKDEWIQKLLPLVEGKPILIELAAEWLSTTPPPDWLLHPPSDQDLQIKQEDFAANLVRHITQLRTPMDRLLLVLSRVYPFDVEMAEELLGLSRQDAETLITSAKTYVFVKTLPGAQITLHDEMRKMVDDFVWPFIDEPGEDKRGERRRRDSRRAVAIFERRLEKLAEFEENKTNAVRNIQSEERRRIVRMGLNEQLVEHSFYADVDSGFDVFTETWDEAKKEKEYLFAERMLVIANPFEDQFTEEQKIHYVVMQAWQRNYTGYNGISIEELREYAERYHLSAIYNALGIAERKSGSMKDAVSYLSRCLKIIQRTNPDGVPYVANQLGYTYRLMGDLKKAQRTYERGLTLALEAQKPDKDLIASLFNNLGYVLGLHRKYDAAENYCLQAEKLWREMDLIGQIGRVSVSLGIFARDRGNYEAAIQLFEQAITQASKSDDFAIIGLAYCHLAWAKLFKWEEMNKTAILDWDETKKADKFYYIEVLHDAKKDFDECLMLAEERGLAELLPAILHQMSNVYWWLGWLENGKYKALARTYNSRSREESEQRDNVRYAIDSLVGDAEFDYDVGKYRNIQNYADELHAKYRRMEREYSLYFGRMYRILGDVAFRRGKSDDALNHYTNALLEIQRHGGYGKYSTRWELLRLERKLDTLSVADVNKWLEHFQVHWKNNVELRHWCEKELLDVKLRAKTD